MKTQQFTWSHKIQKKTDHNLWQKAQLEKDVSSGVYEQVMHCKGKVLMSWSTVYFQKPNKHIC